LQVIKIFGHTTPFFQAIKTKLIDSSHHQCQASSQQQNAIGEGMCIKDAQEKKRNN
jgi:hypothetical protein